MTWQLKALGCLTCALALVSGCTRDNPAYDDMDGQAEGEETSTTAESGEEGTSASSGSTTQSGDGDGDPTTTGDPMTTGDPDTGDGDGDGDMDTGDPTGTGDGDGDPDSGDGDGDGNTTDPGTGDGDGDLVECYDLDPLACDNHDECVPVFYDEYYFDFGGMETCLVGDFYDGCVPLDLCFAPNEDIWCHEEFMSAVVLYDCMPPFIGDEGYGPCPPLELDNVADCPP